MTTSTFDTPHPETVVTPNPHISPANAEGVRLLPSPPRILAQHESRATATLMALGLFVLVLITILCPVLDREEARINRRQKAWAQGEVISGVITQMNRGSLIGRKTMHFEYEFAGVKHEAERVITKAVDFERLAEGESIELRIDPLQPGFAAIKLDIEHGIADWVPLPLLTALVFVIGGLLLFMGFRRRQLLLHGEELPCDVDPSRSKSFARATYLWQGTTYERLVDSSCGLQRSALLIDRNRPRWPILASPSCFAPIQNGEQPPATKNGHRWAQLLVPATIGGWVAWGVLSLVSGEAIPALVRLVISFVVACVLAWIGSARR